jgi:excinuclease ABC subunit A
MPITHLRVLGAAEHNLKNIDVEIPRNALTVITGLSGSGKSSLAFDTIYAEGQRRYMESLSAYARQFLEQLPKPHVEKIEGLSPAISIDQKTVNRNPRSTVGTTTEIYDYLRVLFTTIGRPHCPHCDRQLERQSPEDITEAVMSLPERTRIMILAPVIRGRKGEYQALFQKFLKDGFVRAKINGELIDLDPSLRLKKTYTHEISAVVDRLVVSAEARPRVYEAVRLALSKAERLAIVETLPGADGTWPAGLAWQGERLFSEEVACPVHGPQAVDLAPRLFSFNSKYGACPTCDGIGKVPIINEARLITEPSRSLSKGCISLWESYWDGSGARSKTALRGDGNAQQLFQVIKDFVIDDAMPWQQLSPVQKEVLLYGFRRPIVRPTKHKQRVDTASWRGLIARYEALTEDVDEDDSSSSTPPFLDFLEFAPCPECHGARLRKESLAVTVGQHNIAQFNHMNLIDCLQAMKALRLTDRENAIAKQPLREITDRLGFLIDVGLHYLTLDRPAGSLSGGEAQRIRLATQIGSRLTGVLYVLDEPSIGLHQRDNEKLISTLHRIRDQGNTVLVVEHDEQTIREADYVVDLGPGAGALGGQVMAAGTPDVVTNAPDSLTGKYLRGEIRIEIPAERRKPLTRWLTVEGATLNNLRDVTLRLPAGLLIGITGVSGSGKSSLIMETLLPLLMNHCYKASHQTVGPHRSVTGLEFFDRCINVDQSPIGRTPRSNPATYTKVFDAIRDLFALTAGAREKGYAKGRFSFNTKGGRCEHCGGQGSIKMEMNFLPNVYVPCDQCEGTRYNPETLQVTYKGKNIADVLAMTVSEAVPFFEAVPQISAIVNTLHDVGLGYIQLGQSATTLSGGEAQRMKLAKELSKRNTGRSLYILDEPTTGLHFSDVHMLLNVFQRLTKAGSTVLVIEHQLDIIKCCDWLIDLGPEGGSGGGEIIAQGPPEVIAAEPRSETGRFLRQILAEAKR